MSSMVMLFPASSFLSSSPRHLDLLDSQLHTSLPFPHLLPLLRPISIRHIPLQHSPSISSTLNSTHLSHSLIFSHYSDPSLFDTFLFNTLIKCYPKSKEKTHLAIETYKFIIRNGVSRPNGYTFPVVLRACAGAREMGLGEQVHGAAVRFGFVEERHCRNGLVYMSGCLEGDGGVARKRSAAFRNWTDLQKSDDALEVKRGDNRRRHLQAHQQEQWDGEILAIYMSAPLSNFGQTWCKCSYADLLGVN
ncbi:hypothetical protein Droror1_Dr00021179 [Drosera rotundifolia]